MEPEGLLLLICVPVTCPYTEPGILSFTSLYKYFAEVPASYLLQYIILFYTVFSFIFNKFLLKKGYSQLIFRSNKKYEFNVLHT
jgi:hypothetical protein